MSEVICHISMSLDGFVAGPRQSASNPIGESGLRLHEWVFATASWQAMHTESGRGEAGVDSAVASRQGEGVGAYIMGRNMFDPGRGEWDPSWRGWWGEDPPYHVPVFVLTHYEREPLVMDGATTFFFVTGGASEALALAREAAGGARVAVAGGARTIQQYLASGLLDELHLHVAPVVLGVGERLLANVGDPVLEPFGAVLGERATHLSFRVVR